MLAKGGLAMEITSYDAQPVGVVRSSLKDRKDCPKQGREGAPEAVLEIDPAFADALDGLAVGQEILVLTWLHEGNRDILRVHPRGNPEVPLQGVFATRSPDRPNPTSLPLLPFRDREFDIALSSHFLFLYTDNLSYDFHVRSVREMLRVAGEVRIFPLLDVNTNKSSYVEGIIEELRSKRTEVRKVSYEFQIGGNEMLIIKKASGHKTGR